MTKRFARIAVVAAAAASLVLPASSASASCSWTFPDQCVKDLLAQSVAPIETCVDFGTFPICLPATGA